MHWSFKLDKAPLPVETLVRIVCSRCGKETWVPESLRYLENAPCAPCVNIMRKGN